MLQLYTANFLWFLIHLKWFFQTASNFPNFEDQNAFFAKIQQAPGPDF